MAASKKTEANAVETKEKGAAAAAPAEASKVSEEKKEAPKKTAARKPAAPKKAAAKEPAAKKEPAKKAPAEMKAAVYIQFAGKQAAADELVAAARKAYVAAGHKETEIKTLEVYVKPEENAAYYAVNGEGSEEYKIEY